MLLVHVVGDPWLWAWSEIDGVNERNGPGNTLPWSKALTDGATIAASRAMYWFDLSLIPLALGLADGLRGPRRRT